MLLRVWPPMLVKLPPAKILPSVCTAIIFTFWFTFGSNESAKPVVGSSRAMRLRVCPPMLTKLPPARILPSACTAIAPTARMFGFGSNESAKPVITSSAGEAVARLSAYVSENAGRQNLAVCLQRD